MALNKLDKTVIFVFWSTNIAVFESLILFIPSCSKCILWFNSLTSFASISIKYSERCGHNSPACLRFTPPQFLRAISSLPSGQAECKAMNTMTAALENITNLDKVFMIPMQPNEV